MPKRNQFTQISLRLLLVLLTIACLWLGKIATDARRQKSTVQWVEEHGGSVAYDWQFDPQTSKRTTSNPAPAWLRGIFGDDTFQTVTMVSLSRKSLNSDFSRLADLPSITVLNINDVPLNDLTFLEDLQHIENLVLRKCGIVDISALAELPNLKDVFLDDNKIVDLAPLVFAQRLTTLTCSNNRIRDLSPIARMPSLVALDLSENPISDLSPLAELPSIEMVRATGCEITDCSPLMRVPTLFIADLQQNTKLAAGQNLKLQKYVGRERN